MGGAGCAPKTGRAREREHTVPFRGGDDGGGARHRALRVLCGARVSGSTCVIS